MPSDSEDELHPLLPGSPASRKRSPLGVMGLAVLSYFSVCGGPFGLEVAIAAGGPAPVVASILTLALLWAMPVALMTSELGSALPSRGGYMYWVERAFGRRLGAVNGWFSICTALLDSSSYPAMFCGYVTFALARWTSQPPLSELQRWAVSAALTCTVCALNLRGISLAARASIALACISMGPFVILLGLSLRDDPAALLGAPLGWVRALAGGGAAAVTAAPAVPGAAAAAAAAAARPPDWLLLLSTAMWSTSGFDSVSLLGADVHPFEQMPRTMALSLSLMLAGTIGPIAICTSPPVVASAGYSHYKLGAFAIAAETMGGGRLGAALGVWVALAGMAASAGLINSFLCTAARGVQAMAQRGLLPSALRGEPAAKDAAALGPGLSALSPAPALLVVTAVVLGLVTFPFAQLVEIDMSLYAVSVRRRSHLSPHRATPQLSHAPHPPIDAGGDGAARAHHPPRHRARAPPPVPHPAAHARARPPLRARPRLLPRRRRPLALQRPRHPHLLGLCHRRRRRRLVRRDLAGLGGEVRAREEAVRLREALAIL